MLLIHFPVITCQQCTIILIQLIHHHQHLLILVQIIKALSKAYVHLVVRVVMDANELVIMLHHRKTLGTLYLMTLHGVKTTSFRFVIIMSREKKYESSIFYFKF